MSASLSFVGIMLGVFILGVLLCYFCVHRLISCLDYCLCMICKCKCVDSCCRHQRNHADYEKIDEISNEENLVWQICGVGYEIGKSSWLSDIEKSFGQDTCGICLREMSINDELYRALCGHRFHPQCLEQWLKENNRCPLCTNALELLLGVKLNI